jgi:N-acetylglucosaminyl-diphospho-decaprenol L-rhamnosyltransferase
METIFGGTISPIISIIIVTFNTSALTRICLQSVLADSAGWDAPIEIIVVDNASTDDTVSMISRLFPSVRLIVNAENVGYAKACNIGMRAANGRYLLLLNSDTQVQPGTLRALVHFMERHPEAGACGPKLLNEDQSLQPSGRPLPSFWSVALGMTRAYRLWKRDLYIQLNRNYDQVASVGEISGAAIFVRRDVYQRVGGLDERFFAYYEDVDWCKRIGEAGYKIYYVPEARVIHRWRGTSGKLPKEVYSAGLRSLRYYFTKHHSRAAQMGIQLLLAGKETVMLAKAAVQRRWPDLRFHWQMMQEVFAPITGGDQTKVG